MSERKYILRPDIVVSENDGQHHWISGHMLAKLYNLPFGTYLVGDVNGHVHGLSKEGHNKMIKLGPRYKGNYPDLSKEPSNG